MTSMRAIMGKNTDTERRRTEMYVVAGFSRPSA